MAKYIIRFDDFYVGMERNNLLRVSETILQFSIPAIIGVVPSWQDDSVVVDPVTESDFWGTIRKLRDHGCEIALHGFTHKLFAHKNLLAVNSYGEFSGLEYSEQKRRISEGLKILMQNGIQSRMFMPPAHSFDQNTVLALKESGIPLITDGKCFFPYDYEGVLFLPQISSKFKNFYPFGIITICLHPQWLNDQNYIELSEFCRKKTEKIISVEQAIGIYKSMSIFSRKFDTAIRCMYFFLKKTHTS